MDLIILDIDDTLTRSNEIDTECFLSVMARHLNFEGESPDWDTFECVTDEGIARGLLERADEDFDVDLRLATIREEFTGELQKVIDDRGIEPVPGAGDMLSRLEASSDFAPAIATGCWEASARIKLEEANLPIDGVPMATSSDAMRRIEILCIARRRASRLEAIRFDSTVYVGDGVWDLRAARQAGFAFIGLAAGPQAERLREAGATQVLPDFRDVSAWQASIEQVQQGVA